MVIKGREDRLILLARLAGARREDLAQGRDEISLAIGFSQQLELLALQVVSVDEFLGIS